MADWLTRTKMYDRTCFVSFEQGGDAPVLLSALGDVLAINNGGYPIYDPPATLAILVPLLKQHRVLIIADNVEDILPGGDAALDEAGRGQLWQVLTELQSNGAGVLITSRNAKLDSRLAPFEGGALELNLFNVTEMSQDEWSDLRQALEQTGLLVQENTFEGINMKYQHLHPVLTPYLRSLPGTDDPTLQERYVTNYYQFAYYLSSREQGLNNQINKRQGEITRAWARVEFPNLWRSLQLLMDSGDVGLITAVADILLRFLDFFGRWRERDTLRRSVLEAIGPANTQIGETLTWQVYWQEKSLGEQELERGDWQSASKRFQALLFAIETLPENEELGRNSLAHAITLQQLARALKDSGQRDEAYARVQEALSIIRELLERDTEQKNTELMHVRGTMLADSGDLLRASGQFAEAQQYAEQARQMAEKLPNEDMTWTLYRVLATIAELEGQANEAEAYRRHEREVYAEFPAHRAEAEQKYGPFIANVAAAARGDEQARTRVDAVLADFDASEQMHPVAVANRRILAGERDWHALCTGIVPYNAMVLRLILESLGVTVFS